MNGTDEQKTARLYRMVMPGHICPYGLKSKDLLERQGFEVEDHHLTTREETDAFMEKHGVETTPQTFVGNQRIGAMTPCASISNLIRQRKSVATRPIGP